MNADGIGIAAIVLALSGVAASEATTWRFKTNDVQAMRTYSDAIVVAEHRSVRPGREVGSLEFELNTFVVTRVIKGQVAPGDTLTVERAGKLVDGSAVLTYDGGPFSPAGTFLLFLKKQRETDSTTSSTMRAGTQ